ncbi:MAG: HRDC domain-containing protein [Thermodesulfobacteriota bacterium]
MNLPTEPGPPYRLVTSSQELAQIVPSLMKEKVIAVDVEADSMFHFTEKVCLLQIATVSQCLIIDPLAAVDLFLLKPLFLAPEITKIFHGASYDVRCLGMCCDITINNLFDTEIACRFLGIGESGLNAVVQQTFQVALDKKYQKKDWSRRPLPAEMLEYAARDVHYLIPLRAILAERLAQMRRASWVEEECRMISIVRCLPENGQPLFLKVKGAGRLDRHGLAILENLLQKRMDIARKKDLPPFKIIGNTALIRLAEEKPASRNALKQSRILSDKQVSMYAEPICLAIREALEKKEDDLPVYPREKHKPLSRKATLRVDALKQWREATAARLAMDPGLILPNALAIGIARENPRSLEQLDRVGEMKEWRKKEFGEEIVRVLSEIK